MLSSGMLSGGLLIGGHPTPRLAREIVSRPVSVSDTGDFATTAPTYTQYPTPLWCVAAVANIVHVSTHTLAAQRVQRLGLRRLEDDTLPAHAVTVARTCGARFTLANTATSALPDLFTLALYAGNDTLAQTILTTLVTHAGTPNATAARLLWGIQTYLAVPPARVAAAEAAAAHLDALGPAVWKVQANAHLALIERANAYTDLTLLQRELRKLATVTQGHLEESSALTTGFAPLWTAYKALMRVTWLLAPDSTAAVAEQLTTAFRPPGVQQMFKAWCHMRLHYCAPPLTATPIEQIPAAQLTTAVLASQGIRLPDPAPAPPLTADFWFPVPHRGPPTGTHDTAGDTLHLAPGHVSLIYHWSTGNWTTHAGACARFNLCNDDVLFLKALTARYGTDVSLTMLVDADSLTALSVPDTARAVAASYQWFFQTYLGLPANVAVRMRTLTKVLPEPDGRLFFGETRYHDAYLTHAVTLLNPQRQIVLALGGDALNLGDKNAATLALVVERLLHPGSSHTRVHEHSQSLGSQQTARPTEARP
jgi:hypothetical protein